MEPKTYPGSLIVDWYKDVVLPVIEKEWCNSDYEGEE
jgi:hypothetical protein